MKSFFAAIQFLTVIPLPHSWGGGEKEFRRCAWFFPLVGLVIGGLVAAFDYGLLQLLPPLPASALTILFLLAISGALHLDGLADTADGFMSSRPRERILEIMKDSRTGAMGAAAIAAMLILKISMLSSISGTLRWRILLLAPLAGRCAFITTMLVLPYARAEGGLGSLFLQCRSPLNVILSLAVLFGAGWFIGLWAGLAAALAAFAIVLLFAAYSYRKIRGFTGDTLGAACEIAEFVVLLTGAIWVHKGGSL